MYLIFILIFEVIKVVAGEYLGLLLPGIFISEVNFVCNGKLHVFLDIKLIIKDLTH